MSDKSLRAKVAELGDVLLTAHGFERRSPFLFERKLGQLIHGIEFQKGRGSHNREFTVNIFWRFEHNPLNYDWALAFSRSLGEFMPGLDEWFVFDPPDTLGSSFLRLQAVLADVVLPFLDEHSSISAIVHKYETGGISASSAFGSDVGWQNFNLGFCYLSLGEKEKAAAHFKVVAEISADENETEEYLKLLETGKAIYTRLTGTA